MKPTLLAVALLLSTLSSFAQRSYNAVALQQYLQNNKVTFSAPPRPVNPQRNSKEVFALDYDGVDDNYTAISGGSYTRYAWDINRRYRPIDLFTLKYALVNYDSIIYLDMSLNPVIIPLAAATMRLDSLDVLFTHTNNTGNADTITISVLNRSSFQVVNPGRNGYHTGSVLWDTTIITTTSLSSGGNYGVLGCYPNLQFARGETFSVRVDFAGDTADKFQVACGSRDDCMSNCLAEPSVVKENSHCYLNWDEQTANSGTYGSDSIFFDCDQSGDATLGGCERIYLQNFSFIPYITADVVFSASLPSGPYALCNGQNQLPLTVAGAETTLTYAWSPVNGLSDPTVQRPAVTSLINPVTYTVTVTDANNQTVTASIYVSTDQSLCAPADTISGAVYFDTNNNGVKDNGETGPQAMLVNVNGTVTYQTDSNGMYSFVRLRSLGTHYIGIGQLPDYSWLTQPSTLNGGKYIFSPGLNHTDVDFGIHVSPDSNNVRIDLVNVAMPPRPGFQSQYNIYSQNTLGTSFEGTVTFNYSQYQTYTSATPVPDNIDTATRTLSWNLANLQAGGIVTYSVTLNTIQSASILGSIATATASITPNVAFVDVDSFDNVSSIQEVVVGAYDPNDKAVSPPGVGATNSIKPNAATELTYTIRFQNTGTFYAENVAVADTIDTDLDLATFKMVKASHAYSYELNGNAIMWRFNGIMLPDSNTNEPGSHGFIQYKIKPKANIQHLSVIENTAYIYFDFNEAVVTNTTSNLVDFYLTTQRIKKDDLIVRVYPNPFTGQTNFSINTTERNLTLRITDIAGRLIDEDKNITTPFYTYQATDMAKGLYNFDIRNADGIIARGKLMIQ